MGGSTHCKTVTRNGRLSVHVKVGQMIHRDGLLLVLMQCSVT